MFVRPATPTVQAAREASPGLCPHCNTETLQAYRVLSEGGWWRVVKCSHCLTSVSREPGPLLGPLGDAIHGLIPTGRAGKP